jgi:hypothetical protein
VRNSGSLPFERRTISRWLVLAGLATVPGCDGRDATSFLPRASAGGGGASGAAGRAGAAGVGGAAGAGAGGAASGGAAGNAGLGGSSGDGGLDLCVQGPVELYCGAECPEYADARGYLRRLFIRTARLIVERPCVGLDGSERVSVGAEYQNITQTFVYDAQTRALVAAHYTDDLGDCSPEAPDSPLDYLPGWYGDASPDCAFRIPSACEALDAGVGGSDGLDGGADAGTVECILPD